MASNPMQRQKQLSFWKGVLITLLICAIIIGGLGYMLYKKIEASGTEIWARCFYL